MRPDVCGEMRERESERASESEREAALREHCRLLRSCERRGTSFSRSSAFPRAMRGNGEHKSSECRRILTGSRLPKRWSPDGERGGCGRRKTEREREREREKSVRAVFISLHRRLARVRTPGRAQPAYVHAQSEKGGGGGGGREGGESRARGISRVRLRASVYTVLREAHSRALSRARRRAFPATRVCVYACNAYVCDTWWTYRCTFHERTCVGSFT